MSEKLAALPAGPDAPWVAGDRARRASASATHTDLKQDLLELQVQDNILIPLFSGFSFNTETEESYIEINRLSTKSLHAYLAKIYM